MEAVVIHGTDELNYRVVAADGTHKVVLKENGKDKLFLTCKSYADGLEIGDNLLRKYL